MKETPILFTPENVRKVLAGTKTQTRRIVKPQPVPSPKKTKFNPSGFWWSCTKVETMVDVEMAHNFCPYGQPGDRLWVREAWRRVRPDGDFDWAIEYKADGSKMHWMDHEGWFNNEPILNPPWKPSIHMPRKFCRLWLELTAVRVERLWKISEEDCRAEGIEWKDNGLGIFQWTYDGKHWFDYATDAYLELWKEINGLDSWNKDPWVWVLTFQFAPQVPA